MVMRVGCAVSRPKRGPIGRNRLLTVGPLPVVAARSRYLLPKARSSPQRACNLGGDLRRSARDPTGIRGASNIKLHPTDWYSGTFSSAHLHTRSKSRPPGQARQAASRTAPVEYRLSPEAVVTPSPQWRRPLTLVRCLLSPPPSRRLVQHCVRLLRGARSAPLHP